MRTWTDGSTAAATTAMVLAVLVALARHLAKPWNKPQRTLVFVASAVHHTRGIKGPRSFVARAPRAR